MEFLSTEGPPSPAFEPQTIGPYSAPSPAFEPFEPQTIGSYVFIQQVKLLGSISVFIGLISLDLFNAFKKKAPWIPPGALLLSAFSIQLLDILDRSTVSIGDNPEYQKYDLNILLKNQLLVDGGRAVVCVYMGYLLPSMANHSSKHVLWSDIGALALSLVTHLLSELYVIIEFYTERDMDVLHYNTISIVSRFCDIICTALLFVFLGSAVFGGRTVYNLSTEKIPLAFPSDGKEKALEFDDKVLESWIVAHVCIPGHFIARSELSSSVGVTVTISVVCYALEWITQNYKQTHYKDGLDWLRYTTVTFQCLLILMGYIAILCRWINSVYNKCYSRQLDRYFVVEDFWIRHISEIKEEIESRQGPWMQQISGGDFIYNVRMNICRALRVQHWLLPCLLWLQVKTVQFSKICFLLSEKILSVLHIIWPQRGEVGELDRFLNALEKVVLPAEDKENLLLATKKAIKETQSFMDKGEADARISMQKLSDLMGLYRDDEAARSWLNDLRLAEDDGLGIEQDFKNLANFSWRMTALSLIHVIMVLYDDNDKGRGHVDNALDCYSQSYEFLDLLDNSPGLKPNVFGNAAHMLHLHLQGNVRQIMAKDGNNLSSRAKVERLQQDAKITYTQGSYNPKDSLDWSKAAENNSMHKVCSTIIDKLDKESQLQNLCVCGRVEGMLAHLMIESLQQVKGMLVKVCREWAATLEVTKIRAAVYIAGKAKALEAVGSSTVGTSSGVALETEESSSIVGTSSGAPLATEGSSSIDESHVPS